MTRFGVHTIDSAPEASKPMLARLKEQAGFLPNLASTMATAPLMLEAFTTLRGIYGRTSFSGVEREVISLATSFENAAAYPMAFHSTVAAMQGAPEEVITALRAGQSPAGEPRLAVLSTFARRVIQTRGAVREADVRAVLDAGFSSAQVLEVLVGMAMTTLANQMYHLSQCPLDEQFAPRAWSPAAAAPVA